MAIKSSLGCSIEEAEAIADAYWKGFPGVAKFKEEGSKFVRDNGYVLMCKYSGHKMYWWDYKHWLNVKNLLTSEFWDKYRNIKNIWINSGTHSASEELPKELAMVKEHFQAASKWDRMALNAPTQGSGICILKIAMRMFLEWILSNNYVGKVKICALVHDEAVIEYDNTIEEAPNMLKKCMEDAAALVCKSMPIPSVPEVGNHWIH